MDTHETSPSVLLFFNKERFIFNAGEGLQRFCTEHKIKLSQVDHICLTRVCSETAGGLPGFLLTLAGMNNGSPESTGHVDIWGPPNLDLLVNAMNNFDPHATMVNKHIIPDNANIHENGSALAPSLHVLELKDKHKFKAVTISAILLSLTQLAGSYFKPNDTSIVYICKLHDIRGNFDPEKIKACGLKQGRKVAELEKGFSVKSDLLDIELTFILPRSGPSSDVIGPLIPDPQSNSPETTKVVNCIIHLSPATVVSCPVYEKWMSKFGFAQHIMARTTRPLFPAPSLPSVLNDDVAAPNFKVPVEGSVCGISAKNLLKEQEYILVLPTTTL
ncbi:tRNAse Z TRZ4, mitochondrial-like [Lycium barbarum]|uniref:tRNAse Z TRZ4, mitochondrial-like n=1 Tax=Lycium barbarum TaxID=112863 RepID=UPI00293E94AE|nr:tRNAse Z TRZ4, mitochondrial-like [Lycium barbarum]